LRCTGASQREQPLVADQHVQHTQAASGMQPQSLPPHLQQQQSGSHTAATPPVYEAAQHHNAGSQHKWGSPPHSWQRSPPAGSPPHAPQQRCASACTAVTLGSMSGPLLGSFPVRKLLHSGSGSSSSPQRSASTSSRVTGSTSPHSRGPARRPESAAAGRPRSSAAVPSGFTLRPGSAVLPQALVSDAPVSPSRTQNSPWQQQQHVRKLSPQPQHHHKQQPSSSGPEGLSIRSWGSPDGRAAQQMLKSFLSGQ
jgi:hypothetical protein